MLACLSSYLRYLEHLFSSLPVPQDFWRLIPFLDGHEFE